MSQKRGKSEMAEQDDTKLDDQDTNTDDTNQNLNDEGGDKRGRPSKAEIALKEREEELERTREALHKANKEAEQFRHSYKPWKEIEKELSLTPDEIKQWKEDQRKAEIEAAEKAQDWQKLKEKWQEERENERKSFQEQLEEAYSTRDQMEQTVRDYLVEDQIKNAIIKNGGDELTLDVLTDKVRQRAKIDKDDTGRYKAFALDDDGNPMDFNDVVSSMKNDKMYSKLFPSPNSSGSGGGKGGERGGQGGQDTSNKPPKVKRSEMSTRDRADFIQEYGIAKYKELPE